SRKGAMAWSRVANDPAGGGQGRPCRPRPGRRQAWPLHARRCRRRSGAGGCSSSSWSPGLGGGLIPHRGGRDILPENSTLGQGTALILMVTGTGSHPSHRGHDDYPNAAPDRGRITAFLASTSDLRPRQVSGVTSPSTSTSMPNHFGHGFSYTHPVT